MRIKMRRTSPPAPFPGAPPALCHRLALGPGATQCSIFVEVEETGYARRYVFEVNTRNRHVAQLWFTDRLGRGRLVLAATITLPVGVEKDDLSIEARQSGILPPSHSPDEQARFGPRPFRILVH
jgi:hypothetical protein